MDLCACLVTCARAVIMSTRHVTFPSGTLCKMLWFFLLTTTSTSACYLLLICIFWYRKVCLLLKTEVCQKIKRSILLGLFAFVATLSASSVFSYGERNVTSIFKGENVIGITCSTVIMTPKETYKIYIRIYVNYNGIGCFQCCCHG